MNAVVISWYWFLIVSLFVFLIGMFLGVLIGRKEEREKNNEIWGREYRAYEYHYDEDN